MNQPSRKYYAFSSNAQPETGLRYQAPASWIGGASFTVEFWLRVLWDNTTKATWILDVGEQETLKGVHWALTAEKWAQFGFWSSVQNQFSFEKWLNRWVHIATVFDASNPKLTTYVNGQEPAADTKDFGKTWRWMGTRGGQNQVRIGQGCAGRQSLRGLIDEVRIWDTPLPAELIRKRMYQRLNVPQEHLISYVNFPARPTLEMADTSPDRHPTLRAQREFSDLVTNKQVETLGNPDWVASAVPTGSAMRQVGPSEVAIFQELAYQGHSWLFPEDPKEFDLRADLSHCDIGSLRVGGATAARIFEKKYYTELRQEVFSNLPTLTGTKLGNNKPASIQVASTRGQTQGDDWVLPGHWAIASSDGRYLSAKPKEGTIPLWLSRSVDDEGLFRIEALGVRNGRQEVAIQSPNHSTYLTAAHDQRLVFFDGRVTERARWVVAAEQGAHSFSLESADGRCVVKRTDNGFELTEVRKDKEIFTLSIRSASDERLVGELPQGAVAFYEQPNYWGRAWVFLGTHADLRLVEHLSVKSMRLGPQTGVTLFDQPSFGKGNPDDVLHDTPDMSGSTFKGTITSFKVWKVVSPGGIGLESVTTLSQDYRTVDGKAEAFVAYRTSLGVPQNVSRLEVGVTDPSKLEIAGEQRELKADESWTVPVSRFGRVIVTSEATHLFCAGLKIRTDTMAADQHIVLFADQEVHKQLALLKPDELWNAKDHSGQHVLKNRDSLKENGASAVQDAIRSMMAATQYSNTTVNVKEHGAPRVQGGIGRAEAWQWVTHSRSLTLDRMASPGWRLDFRAGSGSAAQLSSVPVFKMLDQQQVQQLLADSRPVIRGSLQDLWADIWNDGKAIAHIIVGKINEVADQLLAVITYAAGEVRKFVVSTVTHAAMLAERILHEVVTAVNKVVEWLAYVFDWGDILRTQKELATDTITALDIFADKVKGDLKSAVHNEIADFRGQIKTLVKELKTGFKHLEVANKQKQLADERSRWPLAEEKLHWFLAKIIPQNGQGGFTANSAPAMDASETDLKPFLDKLRSTTETILDDNVRDAFTEAYKSLCAAFTDPNASVAFDKLIEGLLSVLEALAGAALNLIGAIIDLLLELVGKVLAWTKETLTKEISIPGLTHLWALIAKETPLSLLNVTTLAVAIPTTVIVKLVLEPPKDRAMASDLAIAKLHGRVAAQDDDPNYLKKCNNAIQYCLSAAVHGIVSFVLDWASASEMAPDVQPSNAAIEMFLRDVQNASGPVRPPTPARPDWAMEGVSQQVIEKLELVAWLSQAGMVVRSWPGGYLNSESLRFSGEPAKDLRLALWYYEVGLAGLDVLSLRMNKKRMRRSGLLPNIVASILGTFHIALVLSVMASELKNESPEYKNEVVPWTTAQGFVGALPEAFAFLLLPKVTKATEGWSMIAHIVTQLVAMFFNGGVQAYLGVQGLIDPPQPQTLTAGA